MEIGPEILQWLYVTIVAPVFGWIGGWFHSWRSGKRKKKARIKFLSGLPIEAKAGLLDFHFQGVHTMRGDPGAPTARLLISQGIIRVGPGGGTYDAVDRYLSIAPEFWEVLGSWVGSDSSLLPLMEEFLERAELESAEST